MKSSENLCFSDDFRGNRSELICLILEGKFGVDPLDEVKKGKMS